MKTFTYTPIATDALTATDLREEVTTDRTHEPYVTTLTAYSIVIYNEDGTRQTETAEALYGDGRLGVAWGADATWGDARDVESGIAMWLNDGDAWEAAN